jgi:hypothetical protein
MTRRRYLPVFTGNPTWSIMHVKDGLGPYYPSQPIISRVMRNDRINVRIVLEEVRISGHHPEATVTPPTKLPKDWRTKELVAHRSKMSQDHARAPILKKSPYRPATRPKPLHAFADQTHYGHTEVYHA